MSDIDLMLDEENELTFQLNIEGTRPAEAKCRLRIDDESLGIVLEADSHSNGEVVIIVPPLSHVLSEGRRNLELEVIVDDKFFTPLQISANFEKSIKVEAKNVVRKSKKKTTVTSSLLENSKKEMPVKPTIRVKNSKSAKITENKASISDADILRIISALQKTR